MKKYFVGFFVFVSAAQLQAHMLQAQLPEAVFSAMTRAYETSRGEADSGGVSNISVYRNTQNLSTYGIVLELLERAYLNSMDVPCDGKTLQVCARLILNRDESIMANHQPDDIFLFMEELESWDLQSQNFKSDVRTMHNYVSRKIGAGYKSFGLGYDSVADVFDIILISNDKKTVIVISGDYGA